MKTKLALSKQAEIPLRVREAAVFLGVSLQTVYFWVERKQIPHLRVMGRNIRFLKSELEPFRAQFKQEVVNWQDQRSTMGACTSATDRRSCGCGTATRTASASGNRLLPETGTKRQKRLRERLQAR
jgi:excisionase family DNA binding protein